MFCMNASTYRTTSSNTVTLQGRNDEADNPASDDDGDHVDLESNEGHESRQSDHSRNPVEVAAESVRPQHVISEKHREIQNDADYGGGNRSQRRRQSYRTARRLDERPSDEDEKKAWKKSKV